MAKVLVAEDEADIRQLLVETLFDAGYDVVEAEDGGVALRKACSEHPDVILLDVWMPVMDGFEVLRELRDDPATEATPVIMLTAIPALEGEKDAMALGISNYITKPWDSKTLELTVKVALREAQAKERENSERSIAWSGSSSNGSSGHPNEVRLIKTDEALVLFERKLGGGIPVGSLTLIEGAKTSGKSVFCQTLAYGALLNGQQVTFFTSDHTPARFAKQLASLGRPITKYLYKDDICIYPVEEPDPEEDCGPMLAALGLDIARLPKHQLVFVDAITSLAAYSSSQAVVAFFATLVRACGAGKTIVIVAHSSAFDESMLIRISSMCDTHVRLRVGKVRERVVRVAEVLKANSVHLEKDNLINFEVEPESGIHVIPFSQVRA